MRKKKGPETAVKKERGNEEKYTLRDYIKTYKWLIFTVIILAIVICVILFICKNEKNFSQIGTGLLTYCGTVIMGLSTIYLAEKNDFKEKKRERLLARPYLNSQIKTPDDLKCTEDYDFIFEIRNVGSPAINIKINAEGHKQEIISTLSKDETKEVRFFGKVKDSLLNNEITITIGYSALDGTHYLQKQKIKIEKRGNSDDDICSYCAKNHSQLTSPVIEKEGLSSTMVTTDPNQVQTE